MAFNVTVTPVDWHHSTQANSLFIEPTSNYLKHSLIISFYALLKPYMNTFSICFLSFQLVHESNSVQSFQYTHAQLGLTDDYWCYVLPKTIWNIYIFEKHCSVTFHMDISLTKAINYVRTSSFRCIWFSRY